MGKNTNTGADASLTVYGNPESFRRVIKNHGQIAKIKQVKADICFLGTNAIDAESGITDNDWEVVQLKKAMIASCKKVVCLAISEKVNTVQPIQICGLSEIDILITELDAGNPLLKPYADAGIQIL